MKDGERERERDRERERGRERESSYSLIVLLTAVNARSPDLASPPRIPSIARPR